MFSTDDTIAAVATPPGRGGIGVVRLSGPDARMIAVALTGREDDRFVARQATFTRVRRPDATGAAGAFDEVICTYFPAPRSYTGEDVVEISAHGSPVILATIVEAACLHGARLARPGEFTLRAYLNGRLDLVQAEAVADLIEAVTPAQAALAFDQLDGTLTRQIHEFEQIVFQHIVALEASLDFPEETYHFADRPALSASLAGMQARLADLLGGGHTGRLIREGARVVLCGRPNVGKSSLFNALLRADRAIVTGAPGTTRDLLTERCDVGGIPVTLVDTAGMREASDEIEREGVERARRAGGTADLCLVLLDRSMELTAGDMALVAWMGNRDHLLVGTKADLPARWTEIGDGQGVLPISAEKGTGLSELKHAIATQLGAREQVRDCVRISNVRHMQLLERAGEALARAEEAVRAEASEEFVLADLREASLSLAQVVGSRSVDDILEGIFSRFCIGK